MAQFSSRPPFNDDPEPWEFRSSSYRARYRHASPEHPYARLVPDPGAWVSRFNPRPEYDRPQHNPTNPILVAFREFAEKHGMDADGRRNLARAWLAYERRYESHLIAGRVRKAPRDHARKVLARLVKICDS